MVFICGGNTFCSADGLLWVAVECTVRTVVYTTFRVACVFIAIEHPILNCGRLNSLNLSYIYDQQQIFCDLVTTLHSPNEDAQGSYVKRIRLIWVGLL